MTQPSLTFALLVAYQLKHFLADFPLQGPYMLRKFSRDAQVWVPALSAHAAVHGLFTLLVVLCAGRPEFYWLAVLDFLVHFGVDRVKASPNLAGRWKPLTGETYPTATDQQKKGNTYFWWALGADQMAHHLTHYFIVWRLVA